MIVLVRVFWKSFFICSLLSISHNLAFVTPVSQVELDIILVRLMLPFWTHASINPPSPRCRFVFARPTKKDKNTEKDEKW